MVDKGSWTSRQAFKAVIYIWFLQAYKGLVTKAADLRTQSSAKGIQKTTKVFFPVDQRTGKTRVSKSFGGAAGTVFLVLTSIASKTQAASINISCSHNCHKKEEEKESHDLICMSGLSIFIFSICTCAPKHKHWCKQHQYSPFTLRDPSVWTCISREVQLACDMPKGK